MAPVALPFPALTGRGRRARWRRLVARRLLAAALAAASAVLVVREVRPPPDPVVAVLLAAREVPAGAVLRAADLRTALVPRDGTQPGALVEPSDAVGRRLVAGLAPGEALTRTRLVPRGPLDGLPRGRVALHVVAADPGAVDLLPPGVTVRVYPVGGGPPLARSAVVLAADAVPPDDVGAGLGTHRPARGVVLALTADEADAVVAGHGGLEGPVTVGLVAVPP